MNECKKCEDLFEKALYDEMSNEETLFFNEHLASCKECASQYEELQNTLALVKMHKRPEPEETFMNNFWENLEPQLETRKPVKKKKALFPWLKDFTGQLNFIYRWKYQLAGGLALLVVGFMVGKYLNTGTPDQLSPSNLGKQVMAQPAVNVEAANYIERSKVLLLGLVNFDPATDDLETISLPHIQKISRELLDQTPGLKAGLKDPSQQQLKQLVSDLELILLQIANLEAKNDVPGIELIKDGVNSKGIFLKINIQEIQGNNRTHVQKNKTKSGSSNI